MLISKNNRIVNLRNVTEIIKSDVNSKIVFYYNYSIPVDDLNDSSEIGNSEMKFENKEELDKAYKNILLCYFEERKVCYL